MMDFDRGYVLPLTQWLIHWFKELLFEAADWISRYFSTMAETVITFDIVTALYFFDMRSRVDSHFTFAFLMAIILSVLLFCAYLIVFFVSRYSDRHSIAKSFASLMRSYTKDDVMSYKRKGGFSWGNYRTEYYCPNIVYGWKLDDIEIHQKDEPDVSPNFNRIRPMVLLTGKGDLPVSIVMETSDRYCCRLVSHVPFSTNGAFSFSQLVTVIHAALPLSKKEWWDLLQPDSVCGLSVNSDAANKHVLSLSVRLRLKSYELNQLFDKCPMAFYEIKEIPGLLQNHVLGEGSLDYLMFYLHKMGVRKASEIFIE